MILKTLLKALQKGIWMPLLLMLPMRARAQAIPETMQAYTWQSLGTMAGAAAAVLMIVQLIKAPLDKLWKLPTRLVVYMVSLTLLLAAQHFSGGLNAENALLAAVNAVMVALSAYGAYEVTFAKKQ